MKLERIKQGVYAELPRLLELLKAGTIEKEIGVCNGWISCRLHHAPIRQTSVCKFREEDIRILNEGIWRIAERLMTINIVYSDDRNECSRRIKEALKPLFAMNIAVSALGLLKSDVSIRFSTGASCVKRQRFSEEHVQKLVLFVRQLAMCMMSIEFYIDEE